MSADSNEGREAVCSMKERALDMTLRVMDGSMEAAVRAIRREDIS